MKRPSNCGAVTIQWIIGGRYRFGATSCGAFGLVLTSRKLVHPDAATPMTAATVAVRSFFISVTDLEAEVETARDREIPEVDAGRARAADRGGVAAHDGIEARVVRAEVQV